MAVCSVKGSPGATTTALGLGAVLPTSARPVVAECDPGGGDLAARHGLSVRRGLLTMATAARSMAGPAVLLDGHTQPVRLGGRAVPVVAAPAGAAQARAALSVVGAASSVLDPTDRVVVADCGRAEPSSPAWPLLASAPVVLVVVRGAVEAVARLVEFADDLVRTAERRAGLLVAAGGPYGVDEIGELLHRRGTPLPVVGVLPHDPRAAAVLAGHGRDVVRWRRWPLPEALARVAGVLWTPPNPVAAPVSPVAGPVTAGREARR